MVLAWRGPRWTGASLACGESATRSGSICALSQRWSQRMIEHVVASCPRRMRAGSWTAHRAIRSTWRNCCAWCATGAKVGDDSNLPTTVAGYGAGALRHLWRPTPSWSCAQAGIFGQTFRPAGSRPWSRRPAQRNVDRWLEILTSGRFCFGQTADLREYAFRHALLRQAAYEMLPPSEKRWATCCRAIPGTSGERQGIVLADHFERAGEKSRAIRWLSGSPAVRSTQTTWRKPWRASSEPWNLGAAGEELCAMPGESSRRRGTGWANTQKRREQHERHCPPATLGSDWVL